MLVAFAKLSLYLARASSSFNALLIKCVFEGPVNCTPESVASVRYFEMRRDCGDGSDFESLGTERSYIEVQELLF
jgi:hypothetical protein